MVSQHRHVPVIPSLEYLLLLLALLLFRVPDAPAASPGARSIRDCYFQCAPDQAPPLDATQCACGTPALSAMAVGASLMCLRGCSGPVRPYDMRGGRHRRPPRPPADRGESLRCETCARPSPFSL